MRECRSKVFALGTGAAALVNVHAFKSCPSSKDGWQPMSVTDRLSFFLVRSRPPHQVSPSRNPGAFEWPVSGRGQTELNDQDGVAC